MTVVVDRRFVVMWHSARNKQTKLRFSNPSTTSLSGSCDLGIMAPKKSPSGVSVAKAKAKVTKSNIVKGNSIPKAKAKAKMAAIKAAEDRVHATLKTMFNKEQLKSKGVPSKSTPDDANAPMESSVSTSASSLDPKAGDYQPGIDSPTEALGSPVHGDGMEAMEVVNPNPDESPAPVAAPLVPLTENFDYSKWASGDKKILTTGSIDVRVPDDQMIMKGEKTSSITNFIPGPFPGPIPSDQTIEAAKAWNIPSNWSPPDTVERPVVNCLEGMMSWPNHYIGTAVRTLPAGVVNYLRHTLASRVYRTMFSGVDAPG